jgi:hypothetical protein
MIAIAVWLVLSPVLTCIAGRCICFGMGHRDEEMLP